MVLRVPLISAAVANACNVNLEGLDAIDAARAAAAEFAR